MSGGRRRAERPKGATRSRSTATLAVLGLGMCAAAAAWFFLVRAAIDFGQVARDGRSVAWVFTLGATLGATLCLLLVFVLAARLRTRFAQADGYQPRRSSGGRRSH